MKLLYLSIIIFFSSLLVGEEWKIRSSNQFNLELVKLNIKKLKYDGTQLSITFVRQPHAIRINGKDFKLNEDNTYLISDDEKLSIPDRHGEFWIGLSEKYTGTNESKAFKISNYFNANSFGGPETTIIWSFSFQKTTAQQVDAPEPATMVSPALQTPHRPAR